MNPYADVPPILRKGGETPFTPCPYRVEGRNREGRWETHTVDADCEMNAMRQAVRAHRGFAASFAKRVAHHPREFERVHGISVHAEAVMGNTCPTCGCAIADESKACRAHAERVGFAPTVQPEMRAWHERKSTHVVAPAEPGERG